MTENLLDRAGEAGCTGRCGGSGIRCCGPTSSPIGRSRRRCSTSRWPRPAGRRGPGVQGPVRPPRDRAVAGLGRRRSPRLRRTTAGRTTRTACAPGSRPATGRTSRARRGSSATAALEHAGLIWVCLDGRRPPAMPLPAFPEWADDAYRLDQDPAVRLALQRGAAGRELRRLQPLRVGPRGHPGRPVQAGDPGPRRGPDRDHARVPARDRGAGDPAQGRRRRRRADPAPRQPHTRSRCRSRSASTSRSRTVTTSCCSWPRARCRPRRRATSPGTRATTSSTRRRDQGFVDFQQVILEQDRVVVESQRPGSSRSTCQRSCTSRASTAFDRLPPLAGRDRGVLRRRRSRHPKALRPAHRADAPDSS